MAELGQTRDPRALVPGQPDAIDRNVVAIRGRGEALANAGEGLGAIDAHGWTGEAGDNFREKFSYEPPKWLRAADAFEATAQALDGYSGTLRWAQDQAAEAIRLWDEGEEATRQARAAYDRAVAQADAQNRASAAAGDPSVVTVAPFADPGDEKRRAAREILDRARGQLRDAGNWAAGVMRTQGDEAPEEPGFLESAVGAVGGFVADVAEGAWESVTGTGEFVWNLVTNPSETIPTLVQGISAVAQDPIGFAKQTWTDFVNEPGRTIGNILGGAVMGGGVLKAGSVLGKIGKAGHKDGPDGGGSKDTDEPDKTGDETPEHGDRDLTVSDSAPFARLRNRSANTRPNWMPIGLTRTPTTTRGYFRTRRHRKSGSALLTVESGISNRRSRPSRSKSTTYEEVGVDGRAAADFR